MTENYAEPDFPRFLHLNHFFSTCVGSRGVNQAGVALYMKWELVIIKVLTSCSCELAI